MAPFRKTFYFCDNEQCTLWGKVQRQQFVLMNTPLPINPGGGVSGGSGSGRSYKCIKCKSYLRVGYAYVDLDLIKIEWPPRPDNKSC